LTTKMLASTVQFSNNKQTRTPQPPPATQPPVKGEVHGMMIRNGLPQKNKPPRKPADVFVLSGPNRMPNGLNPPAAPTRTVFPTPRKTPGPYSHQVGRCRNGYVCQRLRHLSTSPPHSDDAGSLNPFGSGAP
jgi:hypothetical protein